MNNLYQTGTKTYAMRKSKTYDKGRVCKKKGCDKTLSMYNKKEWVITMLLSAMVGTEVGLHPKTRKARYEQKVISIYTLWFRKARQKRNSNQKDWLQNV